MKTFNVIKTLPSLWISLAIIVHASFSKGYVTDYPVEKSLSQIWMINGIEQKSISTQYGDTQQLECFVNHATVNSDFHWAKVNPAGTDLLTYGLIGSTLDNRFTPATDPNKSTYMLKLKSVDCQSEGVYGCFIVFDGTEQFIHTRIELRVVDPRGPCTAYSPFQRKTEPLVVNYYFERITVSVQKGETAQLKCVVNTNAANAKILWVQVKGVKRKSLTFINYSLTDDSRFKVEQSGSTSMLSIEKVDRQHEGSYECFVSLKGPDDMLLNTLVELKVTENTSVSSRFHVQQWLLWLIILIILCLS